MKLIFLFLTLSVLNSSYCQNVTNIISNSVGLISFEDNTHPGYGYSGTGTLITRNIAKDSGYVYLITNKHVLPTFQQNMYMHFRIKDSSDALGFIDEVFPIFDKTGKYSLAVKLDPDSNDLAVIDVTYFFVRHPEKKFILNNVMPFELLANRDTLISNNISEGDDVLFIGYPNTLYDKRNLSPLVRSGIIATSPTEDFYFSDEYRYSVFLKTHDMLPTKLNGFLIDANSSAGSSGSLVINKPQFFRINKSGQMEYTKNPYGIFYIIGILTDTFYDIDNRLTGLQHINLGGVISANQIIKTINLFK